MDEYVARILAKCLSDPGFELFISVDETLRDNAAVYIKLAAELLTKIQSQHSNL